MYLSMLSNDKKHLFLNLELYMSKIDGAFSDEEKQIIDVHCMEMHIDNNNYEAEMPLDEVLKQLKEKLTHKEQRIVFLELIATIMADNAYHITEKALTSRLANLLSIDDDGVENASSIINDMKSVYKRCADYIK